MKSSGMKASAVSQSAVNKSAVNTNDGETQYSDNDIMFETKEENQTNYTKSEITRMSTAELQDLAFNNGIENAYDMTGSDLKKLLVQKFNL